MCFAGTGNGQAARARRRSPNPVQEPQGARLARFPPREAWLAGQPGCARGSQLARPIPGGTSGSQASPFSPPSPRSSPNSSGSSGHLPLGRQARSTPSTTKRRSPQRHQRRRGPRPPGPAEIRARRRPGSRQRLVRGRIRGRRAAPPPWTIAGAYARARRANRYAMFLPALPSMATAGVARERHEAAWRTSPTPDSGFRPASHRRSRPPDSRWRRFLRQHDQARERAGSQAPRTDLEMGGLRPERTPDQVGSSWKLE